MKFEIDLNWGHDDALLKTLGAEERIRNSDAEIWSSFYVELNTFQDLEELLKEANKHKKDDEFEYSAIVSFDPPMLYLDNKC